MLEHPHLLLLPWSPAPGRAGNRRRDIIDPDTGDPLGFVCRRPPALPAWLSWLGRPALEIHEDEDASLLCIQYGPRFYVRGWEVYDAEEHLVGTLRGNAVRDRLDRTLAAVEYARNGTGHRFTSPDGYELGTLTPAGAGVRLTFAPLLGGDPFAKMVLLAAALALTNSRSA
jgi:hypothetical protein